jgi:hypothetical protein
MRIISVHILRLLALSWIVSFAVSQPSGDSIDWNAHKWQAPTSTDSRGPCPGLNTYVLVALRITLNFQEIYSHRRLANHGFLPRNGINITVAQVLDAVHGEFFLLYRVYAVY